MSALPGRIRELITLGERRYSAHAVRELSADGILIGPLVERIGASIVVEEYPDYHKGPCVLVLQFDETEKPVHLLWGIPKGQSSPAVLITAYRPDPSLWNRDFTRRKSK